MLSIRPNLTKRISVIDFTQFYWKKTELIQFCRENTLSTQGSKQELSHRIKTYLTSGKRLPSIESNQEKGKKDSERGPLTPETFVICYKSDPVTRAFFTNEIGPHFRFKADVLTWIKTQRQQQIFLTYGDIIEQWKKQELLKDLPGYERAIPKQFQYNQFMRDWKQAKVGKGAKEAWSRISAVPGEATYAHYLELLEQDS